jgi:hypothetical protein
MAFTIFQHFGAILGDKTTYRDINLLACFVSSSLEVDPRIIYL